MRSPGGSRSQISEASPTAWSTLQAIRCSSGATMSANRRCAKELDLVLGPERLFRRPVIDEHDFYCGRYLRLRTETLSRSGSRPCWLNFPRRPNGGSAGTYGVGMTRLAPLSMPRAPGSPQRTSPASMWALPLLFVGRYDREEDDFIGNTFFDHPAAEVDVLDERPRSSWAKADPVHAHAQAPLRICVSPHAANRVAGAQPTAWFSSGLGPEARWCRRRRDVAGHAQSTTISIRRSARSSG